MSIISIHEKLKDKDVAGINKINKNISDPIFPMTDDIEEKTLLPIMPPKLLPKYKSPIEQKHIIKNIELAILTTTFVNELLESS